MSESRVYEHDPITEIQTDVFMVRGSIQMNPLMRITRNMAIVRHQGDLTLVDPLRLSGEEEQRLERLGEVKRILRLGPMHGVDDPYYIDRYGAELWAPGPSKSFPEPKPSVTFDETTVPPFPDAEFFCFEGMNQSEAALVLRREKRLLLTCDSVQNYGDYRFNSWFAKTLMPFIGFPKTTIVGPVWVKLMTPEGGSLESEFRRLLELEFDQLLSAHGSLLESDAHAAVTRAVDKVFSS